MSKVKAKKYVCPVVLSGGRKCRDSFSTCRSESETLRFHDQSMGAYLVHPLKKAKPAKPKGYQAWAVLIHRAWIPNDPEWLWLATETRESARLVARGISPEYKFAARVTQISETRKG